MADHTDPFSPPGVEWTPVSPRLIGVRLVSAGISALVIAVVVLVAAAVSGWAPLWLGLLVPALGMAFAVLVVRSRVRAWGYAEREEDLLVRRGVLFRSLTVVPYGRMQYVDVNAGPLDRLFGVSAVQLHTASAATDATIPGLVPAEAARLRDRLTALGQVQLAGL